MSSIYNLQGAIMKTIFDTQNLTFENVKYSLTVRRDSFSYEHKTKGVLNIKFDDLRHIHVTGYTNSNSSYTLTFYSLDTSKKSVDIMLDVNPYYEGHNIRETKLLLIAFAAHRLTSDFPNNIGDHVITIAQSLKEKQIKLRNDMIIGMKHEVNINDIRRVVCVAPGPVNNFAIYTSDKRRGLLDKPDMVVPVTSVSAPLLEAIMTKNTGHGIDFSHGNNWDQKTSEFIIPRFMDPGFFISEDGTFKEPWQEICYDRVCMYGYFVDALI